MKAKKLMLMSKVVTVFLLSIFALQLTAQPDRFHKKKDEVKAEKIAFITRELNLTPEEAKVFWPLYDEYEKKIEDENKAFRSAEAPMIADMEKISDKDAMDLADRQIIQQQKILDIKKIYHNKFKEVLPAKKLLKLYEAEKNFKRFLLKEIKQGRREEHR